MKIRRFFGKDMRDALNQVKEELGSDAVIMSNKKLADGVEIVAAYDKEPVKKSVIGTTAARSASPQQDNKPKSSPSLSEIIGDSGPDSLKALLEKQAKSAQESSPVSSSKDESNTSQTSSIASHHDMGEIKAELASLRNVLQFQVNGLLKQQQRNAHPMQSYLTDSLEGMGISPELARQVVSFTPADCSEREAWVFLLKLLANRLKTNQNDILTQAGVVALMGPTGTGKTTTIAKLAARYAQQHGSDKVALITTDGYRIAAYEQLATYGKIIGCPVKKAINAEQLDEVLYQFRNRQLILLDTAGFGQRDIRLIKQLDTFKQTSCATIKSYLVLQANAQRQVMQQTIKLYDDISLQGCIFTKLDECYSLGEMVSVAIENNLPISYLTDGQKVPEDIRNAEVKYMISTAARMYKKYGLTPMTSRHVEQASVAV
ncbi:flagellar biosynthesis protein FlhF [Neptunicella sp.]|uniref:flagellar biosynthesis protein FlhF n=1 Tax=Neptunicella sp. TaxID=2125986 RepID=UPI003F68BCEF